MSEKNVRASSERVVSSKVIGRSNPLFRGFRKLKASIAGVFGGCVMLFIAIGLIIAAVKVVPDNSRKIEALDVLTPSEAKEQSGLVKVKEKPDVSTVAILDYETKNEYGQEASHSFDKSALYFEAEFQIYEQKKETTTETQTVTRDGKDIQETAEKTEILEEWVTKNEVDNFATFTLEGVEVDTEGISKRFDMQTETIEDVVMPDDEAPVVYENPSSQVGDTKLLIKYVSADDELIVIGNMGNEKIDGGEVNMISNYSDAELIDKLESEESAMRWVIRFIAWLMLTAGFSSIVGPILVLTDLIPGLNKIVGCATFTIFGVLSAGIIMIVTFAVTYWWLVILCILGLMVLLGGALAFLLTKKN